MEKEKMKFEEFIEKAITDFLEREIAERKENKFYPSELPYCLRRNYFLYTQPKKWDLATLKIFQAGELTHHWIKEVLLKAYFTSEDIVDFSYEGSLSYQGNGFEISGRYDDYLATKWEDQQVLIEVKTVRSLQYINEVKKHHLMQLNFYLTVLNVKKGYVIYFDRGTLQHKIFEVEQSKELFDEMIKRAIQLHKHLSENKVPLPEAKLNKELSWNCNYCPYRKSCLEAGD